MVDIITRAWDGPVPSGEESGMIAATNSLPLHVQTDMLRYGWKMFPVRDAYAIIIWDEDHDTRIMSYLRMANATTMKYLVAVHEHEGGLTCVWRDGKEMQRCPDDVVVEEDQWSVENVVISRAEAMKIEHYMLQAGESRPGDRDDISARTLKMTDAAMLSMQGDALSDTIHIPTDPMSRDALIMLDYVMDAMCTLSDENDFRNPPAELMHSAMGLVTEAGEFMDALKRYSVYGKELDPVNLKEEYGDMLWYIALGCKYLDCTMAELMDMNIRKLTKRYPDKFTKFDALNRYLTVEREELERVAMSGSSTGKTMSLSTPVFPIPEEHLSVQADRDQAIHHTCMQLGLEVEKAIMAMPTPATDHIDENFRLMTLLNALDAFTETRYSDDTADATALAVHVLRGATTGRTQAKIPNKAANFAVQYGHIPTVEELQLKLAEALTTIERQHSVMVAMHGPDPVAACRLVGLDYSDEMDRLTQDELYTHGGRNVFVPAKPDDGTAGFEAALGQPASDELDARLRGDRRPIPPRSADDDALLHDSPHTGGTP